MPVGGAPQPVAVVAEYLRHFAPSVLKLPAGAREALGPAGILAERAALRRRWDIGATSYDPIAMAVPVPGGATADLLVRRRYTLELGAVIVSGSPAGAVERALGWVESFRRDDVALRALLDEYRARGGRAGLPPATEMKQAFVLAPPAVYAAAGGEVERARAIRARVEPTPLGLRYLACEDGDEIRVLAAPPPWDDALSLVRGVEGALKAS